MSVLVLSPYPERLALPDATIADEDDDVLARAEACGADWIVSYGWRRILKGALLERYAGRIVNLHISYLPHNRGADPNFWSWWEDTPKGVSVHLIDEGVDTGAILAREEARFSPGPRTLATTYEDLRAQVEALFKRVWPDIAAGRVRPQPQPPGGPRPRRAAEKTAFFEALPAGWDTPVETVEAMGRTWRADEQERTMR
ncbi:formyl transferase [Marinicauda salina]|uniref:phosphoribosylglycinamide formyltransferase 1 n=1 Tax=Marinicauda salina TaxID=2135793 RepID=A0A2U2BUA2_9PROT|nr:formyltransferase family protein [Marinicauda salina]PWE17569.1 formyl transferase [Marinicauda salina]